MWELLAQFGMNAVQGILGAKGKNEAALAQQQAGSESETAQWTQNLNDNKAIQEADLQNTIRAGYKAGIINVQRGQSKQAAVQSGLDISKGAAIVTGTATANSYAAGQVGSSVDAVLTDITQKQQEAKLKVSDNYVLQEQNFDNQMHDILSAGIDAQQSAHQISVRKTPDAQQIGIGEVLTNAALQVGGNYMQSQMSLGLGKTVGSSLGGVTGKTVTTPTLLGDFSPTSVSSLPTFDINH